METTVIRRLETTAMLVGPEDASVARVAEAFSRVGVTIVRVDHAAAACDRIAVAMPQVVVVHGESRAEDREALGDRATAVGALLVHVDPELDEESLRDLVGRAAQAAIERKLSRDQSGPAGALDEDAGDADALDDGWGDERD